MILVSILDISTVLSVFYSIGIRYFASKIHMSTCRSVQAVSFVLTCRFVSNFLISLFSCRNAYRAEIATFVVPVAGEQSADTRLRERIDFTSNILFFIEDLFLAVGPGAITTKMGTKINMASSLLWVRNQLAGKVKELMIAKKAGWKVLQNLKNQVNFSLFLFPFIIFKPLEGFDLLWLL